MNVQAEDYNKVNGSHIRDAEETIEKIKSTFTDQLDLIVDVGCGSGNITLILSKAFPNAKIVALDIDPNMIEFAKTTYGNDSIQHSVQDISVNWDNISPLLKELEGKVSLVWSNRALHWVQDKATAANNISRLLRPGGRCFANVFFIPDINEHLSKDEKAKNEAIIKIPSKQEQLQYWEKYFSEAGLKDVEVAFVERNWEYGKSAILNRIYPAYPGIFEQYLNKSVPQQKRGEAIKAFEDLITRTIQAKVGDPPSDEINANQSSLCYGQLRVTGSK